MSFRDDLNSSLDGVLVGVAWQGVLARRAIGEWLGCYTFLL